VSTIKVDSIKSADGNTDLLTLSNGAVSGVIGGRRNLIINGAMQVAQRGTSFTGLTNGNSGYYLDRFEWREGGTSTAEFTLEQSSDAPDGFGNSLKLTTTTTDTLSTGENIRVGQKIESQDLQSLAYGTSSAKTFILSFWVKSSITGNYSVSFYAPNASRVYAHQYSISAANTWEKKVVEVSGDVSGNLLNDNTEGLRISFFVAAASDLNTGELDSWNSYTTARFAAGQQADLMGTLNATWQITGVQLEVGSVATPFEHRSYGEELALCQRYFQKSAPQSAALKSTSGMVYSRDGTASAVQRYIPVRFVQTMRATPSVTIYDGALTEGKLTQDSTNGRSAGVSSTGDQAMMVYGPSGLTYYADRFGYYLDAEL